MKIPENLVSYQTALVNLQMPCCQKDMRIGRILKLAIDSGKKELDPTVYCNTIIWLEQMLTQDKSEYVISILKAA